MRRHGGTWDITLPLRPGRYRYSFVADDQVGISPIPDAHLQATMISDSDFGHHGGELMVTKTILLLSVFGFGSLLAQTPDSRLVCRPTSPFKYSYW